MLAETIGLGGDPIIELGHRGGVAALAKDCRREAGDAENGIVVSLRDRARPRVEDGKHTEADAGIHADRRASIEADAGPGGSAAVGAIVERGIGDDEAATGRRHLGTEGRLACEQGLIRRLAAVERPSILQREHRGGCIERQARHRQKAIEFGVRRTTLRLAKTYRSRLGRGGNRRSPSADMRDSRVRCLDHRGIKQR